MSTTDPADGEVRVPTLFLVEIAFTSDDVPAARREQILRDERRRGRELLGDRRIVRIWRIAGTSHSVSVWSAASRDELDGWLRTLPIWAWSKVRVTELAEHPLELESRGE
jgi:muconolactone delta-isomerase